MSLESAIQKNTAALETLTVLLCERVLPLQIQPMPEQATPVAQAAQAVLVSEKPASITFKTLGELVLKVARQLGPEGKDRITALLQHFNLKILPDAKEDQWPAIAAMAKRMLEEGYDPRDAELANAA
jgi:hypothetical protein